MTDSYETQTTSFNEPLFVLRYRNGDTYFRIFCLSLGTLLFFGIALGALFAGKDGFVIRLFLVGLSGFVLFSGIFQVVDLLFFKEIRLYRDRMVKVWKLIGEREIRLADARFQNASSRAIRARRLVTRDSRWSLSPFKGIFYYEDLPDPKEAKKFNYLLAALSGRKVRELEDATTIETLIKEERAPRIFDRHALAKLYSEALVDYLEEKKFARSAIKASIIAELFPLLAVLIIVFFLIRGKPW
jgi:hypothetical protein